MKRKWIETGQDLLVIFNNYLVVIAFCVMIMGLYKQQEHMVWLWAMFLAVPYFCYWARRKVRNFFMFFGLHFMLPIGSVFLPVSLPLKVAMICINTFYAIWSVRIRIQKQGFGENELAPFFVTMMLGAILLVEISYSQRGWENIYIALAIVYAAGYCMYLFVSNYLRFLNVNESSAANIPEKEIFRRGTQQSFLYVSVVAAFLALTANVDVLSRLASFVGDLFVKLLKFLLSRAGGAEEQGMVTTPVEQILPDMEPALGPSEPTIISEIFNQIFRVAGTLLVVTVIIVGIVKGMEYLWNGFHKKYVKKEDELEEGIDVREICGIEKNKKEGMHSLAFLSHRDRIRKIYRKQVLKNQKAIIGDLNMQHLEYKTAKECCDAFAAEKLKVIYEKVRYSTQDITSEDVRAVKSNIR